MKIEGDRVDMQLFCLLHPSACARLLSGCSKIDVALSEEGLIVFLLPSLISSFSSFSWGVVTDSALKLNELWNRTLSHNYPLVGVLSQNDGTISTQLQLGRRNLRTHEVLRVAKRAAAPLRPAFWVAVAINIKWQKWLEHRSDRMTLTRNDRVTFCPRRKEVYPLFLYLEAPNCSLTFEMVWDKLSEIDKHVLGTKGHTDPHSHHLAPDASHSRKHISHCWLLFLNIDLEQIEAREEAFFCLFVCVI